MQWKAQGPLTQLKVGQTPKTMRTFFAGPPTTPGESSIAGESCFQTESQKLRKAEIQSRLHPATRVWPDSQKG